MIPSDPNAQDRSGGVLCSSRSAFMAGFTSAVRLKGSRHGHDPTGISGRWGLHETSKRWHWQHPKVISKGGIWWSIYQDWRETWNPWDGTILRTWLLKESSRFAVPNTSMVQKLEKRFSWKLLENIGKKTHIVEKTLEKNIVPSFFRTKKTYC